MMLRAECVTCRVFMRLVTSRQRSPTGWLAKPSRSSKTETSKTHKWRPAHSCKALAAMQLSCSDYSLSPRYDKQSSATIQQPGPVIEPQSANGQLIGPSKTKKRGNSYASQIVCERAHNPKQTQRSCQLRLASGLAGATRNDIQSSDWLANIVVLTALGSPLK